jgi:hypothetical protein
MPGIDIHGCTCYTAAVIDGLRAHGGVAILVQNSVHSSTVLSTLQTVSAQTDVSALMVIYCLQYIHSSWLTCHWKKLL